MKVYKLRVSIMEDDVDIEHVDLLSVNTNTTDLEDIAKAWFSTIKDKIKGFVHRIPGFDLLETFLLKYGITFPS